MSDDKTRHEDSGHEKPDNDDQRADRETNYAQSSWTGTGWATMLSAERLAGAFASDPKHDPKHDRSWHTHKIEEDDEPDDREQSPRLDEG